MWQKKLASLSGNVFYGDVFAHASPFSNHECQNQGTANPPWAWHDQFNHSNDAVMEIMTEAGFSQNINSSLIYNPYSSAPLALCGSPENLVISNINDFGADLNWDDVAGANFYRVYYKESSETQWKEINSSQSSISFNNLDVNTTYDIRIASNCNMNSLAGSFTTTCVVCSCITNDFIVEADQVLNISEVTGDIYIKSGKTLTINSMINLNRNSSIIVEHGARLILDGATLTSCHPNYQWDGIIVYGNPWEAQGFPSNPNVLSGGVIEMKSNSIIENAKIGINTSNIVTGGMFGYFDWSGGLVLVSNSTIRNCDIGVNFGPYGFTSEWYSLEDKSHFDYAVFADCGTGVKLTSNMGVEFQNTNMDIGEEGILCINSKINVDNNTSINNGLYGIGFFNTWPTLLGSSIIRSSFNNSNDIYWESTGNATPYLIENNYFSGSGGVFGFGLSEHRNFRNNYYSNLEGLATWETGFDQPNFVLENNFNYNEYATSAYGINNQEYNDNCFAYSGSTNIELSGEGTSIFEKQGDEVDAANNCFYGTSAEAISSGPNTAQFEYFIKKYTLFQDCKHPGNSLTSNYLLNDEFESNQISFDCGNNFVPPTINRNRWCTVPTSLNAMLEMEINLNNEIVTIQNILSYSAIQKKRLIALKKRCLKRLIHAIIIQKLVQEGREYAISYALAHPDFDIKILGYALIADTGDYNRAESTLNGLPTTRSAEGEFKQAQTIYLKYLKDRKNFKLSNAQKTLLETISKNQNELSGFARSIYFVLTSEKIRIKLDHIIPVTSRQRTNHELNSTFAIYPNPSIDGDFFFDYDNLKDGITRIEIFDITGKMIYHRKSNQSNNNFYIEKPGIYIFKLIENEEIVHIQKIVRI